MKRSAFLAEKGYNPVFGARPLKRAIQKELQDPIAEEVVRGAVGEGSHVHVTVQDDALSFGISLLLRIDILFWRVLSSALTGL